MGAAKNKKKTLSRKEAFVNKRLEAKPGAKPRAKRGPKPGAKRGPKPGAKKHGPMDANPDNQRQEEEAMDQDADDQRREEVEDRVSIGNGLFINISSLVTKTGCTVGVLQAEKDFSDSTGTEICPQAAAPTTKQPVACSANVERDIENRSERIGQPIGTYSEKGTSAGSLTDNLDLQQAMLESSNTPFDDDSVAPDVVIQQMHGESWNNDVDELLHNESSCDPTIAQGNDSVIPDGEDTTSDIESEGASVRHVVDVKYLWRTLHEKMARHDPDCPCRIQDVHLWKQVDRGMQSQLFFRCGKCDFECSVWTLSNKSDEMPIHEGTVCGSLAAGIGFATMQAQLAAMGIRCLSHVTYNKVRDALTPHIKNASDKEMRDAAEMEKTLAIQAGHVTPEGIPYITVVVDGAWSKRSYRGGRYDALSGNAVIVGYETGRVLFCGVRNKFCIICHKATNRGEEPPMHTCYKNWGQDLSSTSMEANIIAEGFSSSLDTHGLIYRTVIGDGDSSVYQTILDKDPYAAYSVRVEKKECKNHLLRNFCRHIRNASEAKFARKPSSGSVKELRERVKRSAFKMRKLVEAAIKRRRAESDSSRDEKVDALFYDVSHMPGHFFGDHSMCERYSGDPSFGPCDESEKNLVPLLKEVGIVDIIDEVVKRLAKNADSLLEDKTTNAAEAVHSQGNRFSGGRRVNHTQRNSYELRAHCAAVQHNTLAVTSNIFASAGKRVPRAVVAMERARRLQVGRTKSYRLANGSKRRRRHFGTDKDYGPSCRQPDVNEQTYNALKAEHFEKLRVRQSNRDDIERETADQSDSDMWHMYRKDMLTASKFGEICRMKEVTSCSRLVKEIRYPKALDVAHVADGKEYENDAREQLARELGVEISLSGLFIDRKIPFLGASPDGLIGDDGIVEIKYMAKAAENDYTPEEAIEAFPRLYRIIFAKNSTEDMNKNHKHFYQVQGQLHVTGREYCIFALWAPLGMKHVKVIRDDEFWREKMESKLERFYMQCVLPEIVDSRQNRHMKIREPQYILQAREALKAKKPKKAASAIEPPLESIEVDSDSETVVDLSSTNNDARLESPIPCMAVDNRRERIDEEMLAYMIRSIDPKLVLKNVLDADKYLEDTSLQYFLNIVAKNCEYNIGEVLRFGYLGAVGPSNTEHDLTIIGGNPAWEHWCCIRIEQTTLFVYDSLGRKELHASEIDFIRERYPRIRMNDIVFPDVARQPDGKSCGAYAAAFATALALGEDPSNPKHVRNAIAMRQHMAKIILDKELQSFPTE